MKVTEQTRRRVLDAIPPKGAPLRELSAASGVHISNVRTVFKMLVDAGQAFSMRAGTGQNSKHEVWLFRTEEARELFEESWLDEVARRQKARIDAKAARRKAERADSGKSARSIAAERREARRRAEREQEMARKELEAAALKSKQGKLKKETAAAGAKVFKGGTKTPPPKRIPWAEMPARVPEGLQPVKVESKLCSRFDTKPHEVPPLFSALRPGQYLAPAAPWVEAVAA